MLLGEEIFPKEELHEICQGVRDEGITKTSGKAGAGTECQTY